MGTVSQRPHTKYQKCLIFNTILNLGVEEDMCKDRVFTRHYQGFWTLFYILKPVVLNKHTDFMQ